MHFDSFYSDNLGMPNGLALASQFFPRLIKNCMPVE